MKVYALIKADLMARNTGGSLFHAHAHDARETTDKALCGAKPGRVGYWSSYLGKEITCPRCLKKLEKHYPVIIITREEGSVTGYNQLTEIGFGDFGPM